METITSPEPKIRNIKLWTAKSFVTGFVQNTLGTKKRVQGNYEVQHRELCYTAQGQDGGTETIAIKLASGTVFSNANRLRFCGTTMAWGNRTSPWGQVEAQRWMEEAGAMPVPFSVFSEAKLAIRDAKVIEKASSETVKLHHEKRWDRDKGEHTTESERHYVGACLLEVGGVYFLFDIDREEIKHGTFNPFLVKLKYPASSIAQAYEMLIPDKVKQAIAEHQDVQRQGEWFFIYRFDELPEERPAPSKELIAKACTAPHVLNFGGLVQGGYRAGNESGRGYHFISYDEEAVYDKAVKEWIQANNELSGMDPTKGGELKQGNARPNKVDMFVSFNGMTLVSGTVSHTGREHRDLLLEGWWEAVPNTAVESWQVSGDID